MAAWVYPKSTGAAGTVSSFSGVGNQLNLGQNATSQWRVIASDGANANLVGGAVTVNQWAFLIARFISSTNRRLQGLQFDGSTFAVNDTTAKSPPTMDTLMVGATNAVSPTNFWNGLIAEFWYTQSILLGITGDLDAAVLRQLAHGGPFSMPAIAKDVLEYRSLRTHPTAGEGRDIHVGGGASAQSWTNVNGVSTGPHCPLPYWHVNPRRRRVPLPF